MSTDPQAMSLDLYAQLLQARDRLDDLLPIAERACTNAETLTLTTLQGADADPRPLMLDLTHLQSHLDGLTLNVTRAANLQTAGLLAEILPEVSAMKGVEQPHHAPSRNVQRDAIQRHGLAVAQANADQGAEAMLESDLKTAARLGARVAETTSALKRGRS